MLGRFLELSLVVPDTGTAWQRWLELGFAAAEAGDIWQHAYGALACEGMAIGLHAVGDDPVCVSFVRPEVATLERALADRLIGLERTVLGPDVFNLLELREPGGALLRIQEARTFSPPADRPTRTEAGVFRALSLPCPDLAEARGFWERLDYEVRGSEEPWPALQIEGLPLACHAAATWPQPLLLFDASNGVARTATGTRLPALGGRAHRLLRTPDGVALLELGPA